MPGSYATYEIVVSVDMSEEIPMSFVTELLMSIFGLDLFQASDRMMELNLNGYVRFGPYVKDIASTKAQKIVERSVAANYVVRCYLSPLTQY